VIAAWRAPAARPSEATAAARIEHTMGPRMAWVTGPPGIPASGTVRAPEPVSAYAPPARAGSAYIGGRGLY
jgi:hypothetical protein